MYSANRPEGTDCDANLSILPTLFLCRTEHISLHHQKICSKIFTARRLGCKPNRSEALELTLIKLSLPQARKYWQSYSEVATVWVSGLSTPLPWDILSRREEYTASFKLQWHKRQSQLQYSSAPQCTNRNMFVPTTGFSFEWKQKAPSLNELWL